MNNTIRYNKKQTYLQIRGFRLVRPRRILDQLMCELEIITTTNLVAQHITCLQKKLEMFEITLTTHAEATLIS